MLMHWRFSASSACSGGRTLSVVIDSIDMGRNWFGYPISAKLTRQARQDSAASFLRRFGRQSPACAGAQVFALFPHR